MVSSFGGALQVIGVRAVINDLNRYLNDSKRIEKANEDIYKASQRLQQQTEKTTKAQLAQAAGPSAAFQTQSALKLEAAENRITAARDRLTATTEKIRAKEAELAAQRKPSLGLSQREEANTKAVEAARKKLADTTSNITVLEAKLLEAKKASAEADAKAAAFNAAQQSRGMIGPNLPSREVTAVNTAAAKASRDLATAERQLANLRTSSLAQAQAVVDAEARLKATRDLIADQLSGKTATTQRQLAELRKLEATQLKLLDQETRKYALTQGTVSAAATQQQIRLEEKLEAERTKQQLATERLEASERKLASGRFAGAKAVGTAAVIGGAFLTAGALGGSISAASQYEDILVRIDNFTGITKEQTQQLGEELKEMSKSIPLKAAELAAGAYFTLSSGIKDVGTALEITEQAAKLSTATGTDLADNIRFATRTVEAYGEKNITASQAIDILTAAIRAGAGEPRDFANQLARMIGIANQLNVPLDELAATYAHLTNVMPTEAAGTGLLGILNQLSSPSQQAIDQLEKLGYGLSTGGDAFLEFRKIIQERGLSEALKDLTSRITNINQLGEIFPEVRGFNAFLTAFKNGGSEVDRILQDIRKSAGITDQVFEEYSKTASAQAKILKNELNVALIQIGTAILPIVIQYMRELIHWIEDNKEGIQDFVKTGLEVLIRSVGGVIQVIGFFVGLLSKIVSQTPATVAAIGLIGAAFAWAMPGGPLIKGLLIISSILGNIALSRKSSATVTIETLTRERSAIAQELQKAKDRVNQGGSNLRERANGGFERDVELQKIEDFEKRLKEVDDRIGELNKSLEDTNNISLELGDINLPKLTNNMDDLPLEETEKKFKNFVDVLEDGIISFEEATKPDWEGKIKGWSGAVAGGIEAMEYLRREEEQVQRETFELEKTLSKLAVALSKSEEAGQKLILSQARLTLESIQAASSALFSRPTREEADLNVQLARTNLLGIQTNQKYNPLIEAAEAFKDAREKATSIEIEAAKEAAERRREAMDDEIQELEDQRDRIRDQQEDEIELEEERKRLLQEQLDVNDRFLEAYKRDVDDQMRAMDRAKQLRDRELSDQVDALNKQKEYLERRQDQAIGPAAKRAIQNQIDAIDSEIESRKHSAEAQDRQDEEREFLLREEEIRREREEEDRKNALEAQIEAIEEEVRVRKESYEAELELIEDKIEATKRANDKEQEASERRIEDLEKAAKAEIQRIDDLIESYDQQKRQVDILKQSFQDQVDLIEGQKGIWEAEQTAADNTLLTLEQLDVEQGKLVSMTFYASEQVKIFAEKLDQNLIPEIDEANRNFDLLNKMVGIDANTAIRDSFIPNVDYAGIHAGLMAAAMAAAAERLDNATRTAGASITAAAAKINAEAAAAISQMQTAQEQYESQMAWANFGGAGGGIAGGVTSVYDQESGSLIERWRELVSRYFPANEVQKALNVMSLESGGNPTIVGTNTDGSQDVGLFQINDVHGLSIEDRKNAEKNVAFAADLWRRQGWRPWVAAKNLGYAERGGIITDPGYIFVGEHHKKEMILPLTDIPRSRELLATIPPNVRASMLGGNGGNSTMISIENINLPNADGRTFIPQLEDYMSRKIRLQRRGG